VPIGERAYDELARRTIGVVLVLCVVLLAGPARADAVPVVTAQCSLPPSTTAVDCSSWFRTDVSLHWTVTPATATTTGCQDQLFTADTAGTIVNCSADDGTPVTAQVTIKLDKTSPLVTAASAARGTDVNGWYNRPVSIDVTGTDATSGLADCPSSVVYAGPDSAAVSLPLTCTDIAGNTSDPFAFGLKYDATPPQLSGAPERPPDYAGWFTHTIRFDLARSDATSGLGECPSTVTYAGPDSASASLAATCVDQAGNRANRKFMLKFDATPPPISRFQAATGDRVVRLAWTTTADATSAELLRVPGVGAELASVVYAGRRSSFADDSVANGVRYVYRLRLADAAGNQSIRTVSAVPRRPSPDVQDGSSQPPSVRRKGGRLLFPLPNGVIKASRPPLLRWTAIRRARYYNVQLFRGVRKVLSAWPQQTRYQLRRRWRFEGKRRRLTPGRYRWYVWPGYGRPERAKYGDLLGRRTFRVRR
jgi:hypothetical protein